MEVELDLMATMKIGYRSQPYQYPRSRRAAPVTRVSECPLHCWEVIGLVANELVGRGEERRGWLPRRGEK
jgi:hypothetical protein